MQTRSPVSDHLFTVVVSTPLEIKLSANGAAREVTRIEARGGRIATCNGNLIVVNADLPNLDFPR